MKPRTIMIIVAALVVAAAVVVADSVFGLNVSSAISSLAAGALLWITWLYVRTTREYTDATERLVKIQVQQNDAHRLQAHYTAANALWATCYALEDKLGDLRTAFSDLGGALTDSKATKVADSLAEAAEASTPYADELVVHLVGLEGDLEPRAWQIATSVFRLSTISFRLQSLLMEEQLRAHDEGDQFRLERVIQEWETSSSESELPRWSEVSTGAFVDEVEKRVSEFAMACREAVKARAVGAA